MEEKPRCARNEVFAVKTYIIKEASAMPMKITAKPCISSISKKLHIIKTKFCISSIRGEMHATA